MSEDNAVKAASNAQSRFEMNRDGAQPSLDIEALQQAQAADLQAKGEAEVKPEEVKPTAPETDSSFLDKKIKRKASDWDAMKTKHKTELAALQAQLEGLRNGSNSEFETLKKERDEYQQLLRQTNIERDPAFQQKFQTQIDTAIDWAKKAAGEHGEALSDLLKSPASSFRDAKIDELLGSLDSTSARRVQASLQHIEQTEIAKAAEIQSNLANWDQQQVELATQRDRETAEKNAMMQSNFEREMKTWEQEHFAYAKIEGDDEHNAKVEEAKQWAQKAISGELDPELMPKYALQFGATKMLYERLESLQGENESMRAEIEAIRNATPGDGVESTIEDSKMQGHFGQRDYDSRFISALEAAQKTDQQGKGW